MRKKRNIKSISLKPILYRGVRLLIYLIEIIKKEQALPSLLGVFANIVYFVRKGLASNVARVATRISGKVLVVKPMEYY